MPTQRQLTDADAQLDIRAAAFPLPSCASASYASLISRA
jgi:hypothetical protein